MTLLARVGKTDLITLMIEFTESTIIKEVTNADGTTEVVEEKVVDPNKKVEKAADKKTSSLLEKLDQYAIQALDDRYRFDAIDEFTKNDHLADNEHLEKVDRERAEQFKKRLLEDQQTLEEFHKEREKLQKEGALPEKDEMKAPVVGIKRAAHEAPKLLGAVKVRKIIQEVPSASPGEGGNGKDVETKVVAQKVTTGLGLLSGYSDSEDDSD